MLSVNSVATGPFYNLGLVLTLFCTNSVASEVCVVLPSVGFIFFVDLFSLTRRSKVLATRRVHRNAEWNPVDLYVRCPFVRLSTLVLALSVLPHDSLALTMMLSCDAMCVCMYVKVRADPERVATLYPPFCLPTSLAHFNLPSKNTSPLSVFFWLIVLPLKDLRQIALYSLLLCLRIPKVNTSPLYHPHMHWIPFPSPGIYIQNGTAIAT